MKSKFAPGPWIYRFRGNGTTIETIGGAIVAANVTSTPGVGFMDANAALLAAAPDLLDACEAALADYNSRAGHSGTAGRLRCAIAQAKGMTTDQV